MIVKPAESNKQLLFSEIEAGRISTIARPHASCFHLIALALCLNTNTIRRYKTIQQMTNLGIHTVTSSKNPIAAQKSSNPSLTSIAELFCCTQVAITASTDATASSRAATIRYSLSRCTNFLRCPLKARVDMMAIRQATAAAEEMTMQCSRFSESQESFH